jgi:hypothetical protein
MYPDISDNFVVVTPILQSNDGLWGEADFVSIGR